MINYSLKFGVSQAARMLATDRDTVKEWAFHFSEYLSPEANPGPGQERIFSIDDIRVFSYVLLYWEKQPDLENIKYGLNAGEQYDIDPIDNLITVITPLFIDMPEDIDETWKGVVFGGEFELGNTFQTADSFKLAGDRLVEIAYQNDEERELFQPAIYNYRHATELYLKAIIGEAKGKKIGHDLHTLLQKFKIIINEEFNETIPDWFENVIKVFNYSDPKGTAFRYGETIPKSELYVDLNHVKKQMGWLSESFRKIMFERYNRFHK